MPSDNNQENFVNEQSSGPIDPAIEMRLAYYQAKNEHALEEYRQKMQFTIAGVQGTIAFARQAISALLIIHGSAAIFILGFLSDTLSLEAAALRIDYNKLLNALLAFSIGAFLAALAAGFAYVVAYCDTFSLRSENKGWRIALNIFHVSAIIVVLLGYVSFVIGIFIALRSII